jgi:RimJ/RimL family protein N-acetyltransferase
MSNSTENKFELQPTLSNDIVILEPLKSTDFERLYQVASDPLVWEQHPNKNRYQRSEFENYFKGAMESGGAFLFSNKQSGEVIGSSRFYDWDAEKKNVFIGYTFLSRNCWGKGFNKAIKELMLNHAFQYADTVQFHVGANNTRSQIAMGRIGGEKVGEMEVAYYGEPAKVNFVYEISKLKWQSILKSYNSSTEEKK